MSFVEKEHVIAVPKESGVDGFLHAVKQVLMLPKVSQISIDAQGKITVKRWTVEEDTLTPQVNFDGLSPYNVIRNGNVTDLGLAEDDKALEKIAEMFERVSYDRMHCVAFASGTDSIFPKWCSKVSFREDVFGLPFFTDRFLEDDALILCAAYGRGASMKDVRESYKITMVVREPNE